MERDILELLFHTFCMRIIKKPKKLEKKSHIWFKSVRKCVLAYMVATPMAEYDQFAKKSVRVSLGLLKQFQLHKLILQENITKSQILCDFTI